MHAGENDTSLRERVEDFEVANHLGGAKMSEDNLNLTNKGGYSVQGKDFWNQLSEDDQKRFTQRGLGRSAVVLQRNEAV